jgi:Family of unknown function (DUF5995)
MPSPLPPTAGIRTIDDVIAAIEGIVAWSIGNASRLGYFAALYKKITLAIKTAIGEGGFENGPRMERLDVVFASRYFAALNGFLHPGAYPQPSHSWRVAFDGAAEAQPIIVQQMLAGVNAHIDLDLGIAASQIAPGKQIDSLHTDFDRVNAVLASQVRGVVDQIGSLSPVLADIYHVLMQYEIDLISRGLVIFRDSAWRFARLLACEPSFAQHPTIMVKDLEVAKLGALIFHPPELIAGFVAVVGARESRDVVHNIQVLNGIAETPAPIRYTM